MDVFGTTDGIPRDFPPSPPEPLSGVLGALDLVSELLLFVSLIFIYLNPLRNGATADVDDLVVFLKIAIGSRLLGPAIIGTPE